PSPGEITVLLTRLHAGDRRVLAELAPLMAAELHRVAAGHLLRQPQGHTWQPTDLVNELWLRLLGRRYLDFENRAHFLAVAAHLMRGMLIDHARTRCALKRVPQDLPEDANEFTALL